MKRLIVAYDQNHGIGATGELLWLRDLPADLARFKTLTMGCSVIMGRNTYQSIGRPLPGRQNIVVSTIGFSAPGVTTVSSLDMAYTVATGAVYIIGGGQLYAAALRRGDIDQIYATEVAAAFASADTFFPVLSMSQWREISREHRPADERNRYAFDFVLYERR